MNTIELTKKLISIPSYVDDRTDESAIAEYIYQYLCSSTNLIVEKQFITTTRFNVIAYSRSCATQASRMIAADLLIINHMDTVEPKQGWKYNQFEATKVGKKLFGLGATDTKANIAAMMKTAQKIAGEKIAFLFYCDEEYDFVGMKRFVSEYPKKMKVAKCLSVDGENLGIRLGCRGLIEVDAIVRGSSGHSADPNNGINAIRLATGAIDQLERALIPQVAAGLGYPTLNLAAINGGLLLRENPVTLGKEGNNIADYCQFTLECRTNNLVDAQKLLSLLEQKVSLREGKLDIQNIRHDLSAWESKLSGVTDIAEIIKQNNPRAAVVDVSRSGYLDIAMVKEAFDCPCISTGVIGGNGHAANEWVDTDSIYRLEQILAKVVQLYD